MASPAAVARTIRLFRDTTMSPAAQVKLLATTARRVRDDLIASGEASPTYRSFVDGLEGASEDTVKPDGSITYVFSGLGAAALEAVVYLTARSPRDSGDFRRAWVVVVDGRVWVGNLEDIPPRSTVMVLNPLPYSRKVETGAMRMSTAPGIIEAALQNIRRRFPRLDFQKQFVRIPPGRIQIPNRFGPVPYILKGRQRRAARGRRRDLQAGAELTYPALVITERL